MTSLGVKHLSDWVSSPLADSSISGTIGSIFSFTTCCERKFAAIQPKDSLVVRKFFFFYPQHPQGAESLKVSLAVD